ncbi:hypothetical protein Hbut_1406 [Hyperthermus butylicus DSM 5456]|uniref:Uncharacterized protein n=1 Tax=Hyperthermus butylicus (strain DSM 5456 / JCM 9403 / PLM1-5) TaxID=415426 RepID=A2BML9_HYPBU|nr:hypothetical protein Hbut_1406 [Hyperthermus butylicus DSM 5456]
MLVTMRGQAELISTAIMVGVALVIAYGLIYYLTPLIAAQRTGNEIASLIARTSAAISAVPVYGEDNVTVVNIYGEALEAPVRLYVTVIAFDRNTSRIAPPSNYDFNVYILASEIADASSPTGWNQLASITAPCRNVYIAYGNGYYQLSSFIQNCVALRLYDVGVLEPGIPVTVRVEYGPVGGYQYTIHVLIRISDNYYTVAEIPVEATS